MEIILYKINFCSGFLNMGLIQKESAGYLNLIIDYKYLIYNSK